MKFNYSRPRSKRIVKEARAEGMISSLAAMVVVIGTLALFIVWFVLNANNFQLQTALNLSLKRAQIDGYLTASNVTKTQTYLSSVGLASATVTSPQMAGPLVYGSEIQVTITTSSLPLPAMDNTGHAVPDASRSTSLTAIGYIISQYVP